MTTALPSDDQAGALVPVPAPPHLVPVPEPPASSPADAYLASLAPGSRRTMAACLDRLAALVTAGTCPCCEADLVTRAPGSLAATCATHGRAGATLAWHRLTPAHSAALRAALADQGPAATGNKALSAYRGVLKAARRLGLLTRQAEVDLADVDALKGSSPPAGRHLDAAELARLFRAALADRSAAGARDAALLAILAGAGLRRSEAAALDVADLDGDQLTVRRGKGAKARQVYLAQGAPELLDRWLAVRGPEPGPLFVRVDRVGRMGAGRLGAAAIRSRLAVRGEEAGLEPFTAHDLRRSWIGGLFDAGADLPSVQRLAGHANPATTSRYDRRPERAKRDAAHRLTLPVVVTDR